MKNINKSLRAVEDLRRSSMNLTEVTKEEEKENRIEAINEKSMT